MFAKQFFRTKTDENVVANLEIHREKKERSTVTYKQTNKLQ